MRLDIYINEEKTKVAQDALQLLEMIAFFEDYDKMDEGIADTFSGIKDQLGMILRKAGIHVKQGEGILQYLWKTNKNMAKLFYHGFNAYYNKSEESKLEIKKIIKSIKKENILDFVLKLDQLSLHVLTGPIHMIDALTGTHIWADLQGKALPAVEKARKAIETLEDAKESLSGKMKSQTQKYINALRRVFELEGYKKLS